MKITPNTDLYALPTEGAQFSRVCGGNPNGEHETCFELAAIPGTGGGAFLVRDSKRANSPSLAMTAEELDALAAEWPTLRANLIA